MANEEEAIVLIDQLRDFRKRVAAGEEITDEELKDSIARLRRLRDKSAAPVRKSAKEKAASKITRGNAEDLLKDLL